MKIPTRHILTLLIAVIATVADCHAQYFKADYAPDPAAFMMPRQADEQNPFWAHDMYRHFMLKSCRDSAIYADVYKANYDNKLTSELTLQSYYANYHLKLFEPAFGLVVNKLNNKDIFYFLDSCRQSSNQMLTLVPDEWQRTRPCARLREVNFAMRRQAHEYTNNVSYAPNLSFPSNEGTAGWLTGLLLSTLNPWQTDTIMSRAYQHGWFREVSGGMWATDVDDSRELGTVVFARLMSMPRFRNRLRVLQHNNWPLLQPDPHGTLTPSPRALSSVVPTIDDQLANDSLFVRLARHIPVNDTESSGGFQSDLQRYATLATLRDSVAVSDMLGSSSDDYLNPIDFFTPVTDFIANPRQTPSLYKLLTSMLTGCEQLCLLAQDQSVERRRPFDVFQQDPLTLEDTDQLRAQSDYPSYRAAAGMAVALTLMMLDPVQCDTIMHLGYQYGLYRAIGGSNWHSDIVAGRLAGCMAVSVVASGSDFLDLLESARVEYDSWHGEIITDSPSIRQDSSQNDKQLYTIDGRPATPNSRGILVGRNRKVLVP